MNFAARTLFQPLALAKAVTRLDAFLGAQRTHVLSTLARPSVKDFVAGRGRVELSCSRRAFALAMAGHAETGWTQLHGIRTWIAESENLEAFLERWEVQMLPAVRHSRARIHFRVRPTRRCDCEAFDAGFLVDSSHQYQCAHILHHRSVIEKNYEIVQGNYDDDVTIREAT